jgi:hypothetical protein
MHRLSKSTRDYHLSSAFPLRWGGGNCGGRHCPSFPAAVAASSHWRPKYRQAGTVGRTKNGHLLLLIPAYVFRLHEPALVDRSNRPIAAAGCGRQKLDSISAASPWVTVAEADSRRRHCPCGRRRRCCNTVKRARVLWRRQQPWSLTLTPAAPAAAAGVREGNTRGSSR